MSALEKLTDWLWAEATGAGGDDTRYFLAAYEALMAVRTDAPPALRASIEHKIDWELDDE